MRIEIRIFFLHSVWSVAVLLSNGHDMWQLLVAITPRDLFFSHLVIKSGFVWLEHSVELPSMPTGKYCAADGHLRFTPPMVNKERIDLIWFLFLFVMFDFAFFSLG